MENKAYGARFFSQELILKAISLAGKESYTSRMSETSCKRIDRIKKDLAGLDTEEYHEVLETILDMMKRRTAASPERQRSLLELEGLSKEVWAGIDVDDYINKERDSWD